MLKPCKIVPDKRQGTVPIQDPSNFGGRLRVVFPKGRAGEGTKLTAQLRRPNGFTPRARRDIRAWAYTVELLGNIRLIFHKKKSFFS